MDTWSKVDVACVKSLRLCLQRVYPQTPHHTWFGNNLISLTTREIGNLLPNNRRQRRTCYALCHLLYPVSAAQTSIFRMDSNSTSYPLTTNQTVEVLNGYVSHGPLPEEFDSFAVSPEFVSFRFWCRRVREGKKDRKSRCGGFANATGTDTEHSD